jgi:hypothetical protein
MFGRSTGRIVTASRLGDIPIVPGQLRHRERLGIHIGALPLQDLAQRARLGDQRKAPRGESVFVIEVLRQERICQSLREGVDTDHGDEQAG